MSCQIRAPKAKKVNSYNISRNNTTVNSENVDSNTPSNNKITFTMSLEKRNSIEDIRKTNLMMEYEQICFDESENEMKERVRRLSVLKEINDIVNKQKPVYYQYQQNIERCENPFDKNFISMGEEMKLEKIKSNIESSKLNLKELDSRNII